MKKTIFICIVLFFFIASNTYSEEIIFQGKTIDSKRVAPDVIGVEVGPRFPESEFKELKLPERYWGAYYRLIYSYGEIFYPVL